MSSNQQAPLSNNVPKLKNIKGKAPWNLLNCPDHDEVAQTFNLDKSLPWLLRLECRCGKKWCVCILCPRQTNHMTETRQLTRHKKQHPPNKDMSPPSPKLVPPSVIGQTKKPAEVIEIAETFFSRPASINYFRLAQNQDATRYLVSKAVLHETIMSEELEEDDVNTFMSIAQFVCTLSRTQRENFAEVVDQICDTHWKQSIKALHKKTQSHNNDVPFSKRLKEAPAVIPIPRSKQNLRNRIKEGKNSLLYNLPHPQVHTLGSHSYLLPSECVADIMAHGLIDQPATSSDMLHAVDSLACSPLARAITESNDARGIKTIIVSRWSDDFEPNKLKDNRGSIWISTLTIQTAVSGTPGLSHVYPLVVGGKKDDHEPIEKVLQDDFKKWIVQGMIFRHL